MTAPAWLLLVVALLVLAALGLHGLALWADSYLNRRRADMNALPDPDTLEARNARSLARYYARRVEREHQNRRFTT